MIGNGQVRFGGGPREKARTSETSPAAYPTYARLTDMRTGERLPTFSLRLDPPPPSNAERGQALAEASARHYGRDAMDVDLDLQTALERMNGPHWSGWPAGSAAGEGDPSTPPAERGEPPVDRVVTGTAVPRARKPRAVRTRSTRREHTRQRRPKPEVRGDSQPEASTDEPETRRGEDG
jgi:hypothetical protein